VTGFNIVPEPGTAMLLAGGGTLLALFGGCRRRRRHWATTFRKLIKPPSFKPQPDSLVMAGENGGVSLPTSCASFARATSGSCEWWRGHQDRVARFLDVGRGIALTGAAFSLEENFDN